MARWRDAFSPGALPQFQLSGTESKQEFIDAHPLDLYLSSTSSSLSPFGICIYTLPPLPLSYSSSLLILLATRSIRKLCDRSLSCSFKRHISISPNFLHKRLGEENIRRQWVNIQSLISKIAGNRSRHCQLQRCDASWCRDEERLEKGSLGNKANKEK